MLALSVLMPVRDAGVWLAPALASLWRQTWRDFEVVAIDDGSSDGSGERLDRSARRERRLRVIHLPAVGLPTALNAGLRAARGRLIARHDADDLSHHRRLELQHGLLDSRPEIAVAGCRLALLPRGFSGSGMRRWVDWHNRMLDHESMARETLIDSPLAHGTALIRREALERVGGWNERGWPEDLDLWIRLLESGARFAKHPETLYAWRQHAASATRSDPRYRRAAFDRLKVEALERGTLRGARAATLIGVGESLVRWRGLLAAGRNALRVIEAGRPGPSIVRSLTAPAILVFGSSRARARWRDALIASGRRECQDFVFVA